jgi:glycosyltransferase involved in cell wall biosynthesis
MAKEVSFIIPCLNEGDNLRKTIQSLEGATDGDYEIIVVDNGSTDGSSDFIEREDGNSRIRLFKTPNRLGVARARNFGAAHAEGDILVFVDAHVFFPPGWVIPLVEALGQGIVGVVAPGTNVWGNPHVKGFGMRWRNARLDVEWLSRKSPQPYPVPMVPGGCVAFRRSFFQEIGGFDAGMVNYGSEDLEICLRTWLLGYQVVVVPQVEVSHVFRSRFPYAVNWTDVVHNKLRTVYAHFNSGRSDRVIAALRSLPGFGPAFSRVKGGDVWDRRRALELRRKYDDNWFFDKFGLNF